MRQACLLAALFLALAVGRPQLYAQQSQGENPQVAILNSDVDSKAYFNFHYPNCGDNGSLYLGSNEYQRYFRGWIHVLENPPQGDIPIPYALISDEQLTEDVLNNYKVLILSNTPSMSDERARAIRQWVTRGGRLLATFGAGYKQVEDTVAYRSEDTKDTMKLLEGGTNGLHQLWKDPLTKLVTSDDLACSEKSLAEGDKTCCNGGAGDLGCIYANVRITSFEGPTAGLDTVLNKENGYLLDYVGLGNMFVQRPESSDRVFAFLKLNDTTYDRPVPAITESQQSKGRVIYFAFAPEFDVSLTFGLPAQFEVPGISDADYYKCVGNFATITWGNVDAMMMLMRNTVLYLLNN